MDTLSELLMQLDAQIERFRAIEKRDFPDSDTSAPTKKRNLLRATIALIERYNFM